MRLKNYLRTVACTLLSQKVKTQLLITAKFIPHKATEMEL